MMNARQRRKQRRAGKTPLTVASQSKRMNAHDRKLRNFARRWRREDDAQGREMAKRRTFNDGNAQSAEGTERE